MSYASIHFILWYETLQSNVREMECSNTTEKKLVSTIPENDNTQTKWRDDVDTDWLDNNDTQQISNEQKEVANSPIVPDQSLPCAESTGQQHLSTNEDQRIDPLSPTS